MRRYYVSAAWKCGSPSSDRLISASSRDRSSKCDKSGRETFESVLLKTVPSESDPSSEEPEIDMLTTEDKICRSRLSVSKMLETF